MPTLPKCKPEIKYGFTDIVSDLWFIIVKIIQIIYFFTVGMILFVSVLIALECAFTGKNFFKLFIR